MLADYHTHTYYSDDSECPMEEMVRKAVAIGLDEIAFTEHVDYGVKTDLNCDYEAYFEETDRLKGEYRDRITIKAGIEFGGAEPHHSHVPPVILNGIPSSS